MASICSEHPQEGGGEGFAASTQSSRQKAASHLRRWAPLILVSAGFFWWEEGLSCWRSLILELRVAFFWGERLPCWSMA